RLSFKLFLLILFFKSLLVFAENNANKVLIIPGFEEALVATSAVSADETKSLQDAAKKYFSNKNPISSDSFDAYLKKHPDSSWRIGLWLNLGLIYYRNGAFTDAIEVWDKAWVAGRQINDGEAKAMVDRVFAELL